MNIEKLMEKLKAQLNARGVQGIRSIGRAFKIMQGPGGSGARKVDAG
jgi:Ca2+-binding EF-hand superfamily protein